ncbi:hypothetical protein SAMN05216223_109267 [Actinacidiphila yanglinensis]|uniref:Roadblock/LAMTOR2 domain-containing protein n=1 Tax=Actinacidiphila yanglinensis TaxID=310779 RepID=A0A1H6CPG9_9ACTN|nr:hypothetical protein [Actinacidiphila yanglinensis]SEG74697.1 hypothetical protein SAMN05216223_109267 [Actinacidiphila yanglinensis]
MSGIDACLLEAMTLPGARGAALVEWISGLALGKVGEAPDGDHEAMAAQTADFARAAAEHPVFAGPQAAAEAEAAGDKGPLVEDVVVVTRTGYHLLRFVEAPYEGGVFLHLWLDRAQGNLALALIRLRDLAEGLVLA